MKRRIFIFAGVVWLLIFLAAAGLWVRSYFVLDEWSLVDDEGRGWALVSFQGAVHLWRSKTTTASPRGGGWDAYDVPEGAALTDVYRNGTIVWERAGVTRLTDAPSAPVRFVRAPGVPRAATSRPAAVRVVRPATAPGATTRIVLVEADGAATPVPWPVRPVTRPVVARPAPSRAPLLPWASGQYDMLIIPLWWITPVLGILPAMMAFHMLRRRSRGRRGLCLVCGYDLRASTERCPECGAAIVQNAAPAG
jgi:hypothetical protein